MLNEYGAEYEKLNANQKRAVDYIEGPLLVVAGPGTGKTQLLSLRVANILRLTDAKPENILCLTYTNKAAINMKQRIIKWAGSEATRLPVKTFHSFASEIMNLFPDYFWNAAKLSVAPESVQIEIIESIVSGLPLDNPLALKFAAQYTLIKDIKQAIGLAKDAGLTPSKLEALINVNLAYINTIEEQLVVILDAKLSFKSLPELMAKVSKLPVQAISENVYPLTSLSDVLIEGLKNAIKRDEQDGKTSNTGAWKKKWLQIEAGKKGMHSEKRRNIWWLELCKVYGQYLNIMHSRGYYDYSDMIVEVINALEQNPEILAEVQERFNYVLIDEFQDTNLAQLRLAHLIADHHSSNGQPNLMVVGDDDQTIYKFSGAELNNMLSFKKRYVNSEIIVLTENYRSTQEILDASKKIIEQAENRLVKQDSNLSKDLVAKSKPAEGITKAISFSSRELQYSMIARDIQNKYRPDAKFAVLARSHDSLVKIANIIHGLNVPIRYERSNNILDLEIVNQIYKLSKLLLAIQQGDEPESNVLISELIRHPMWSIEAKKLWALALSNYSDPKWLSSMIDSNDNKLRPIGNWLIELASESTGQPMSIIVEHLLGLRDHIGFTSPINHYFIEKNKDQTSKYLQNLSAIQLLRSLVNEFSKDSQTSLSDFVKYVEINKNNKIIIADESPFVSGDNAVELMTVYKAKGLEFDDVYVIDATDDNWQPRVGRRPPANLPLQPAGDDLDDYIRLMYVAMTRAKSNITISSYYQNYAGKEVATTPIIESTFAIDKISEDDHSILTEVLTENLHWPNLDAGDEKLMLKSKLEGYVLNVTHLLNFIDIEKGGPEYFKERNLLRLPQVKTPSMAYGTAIHSALEKGQKLINTTGLRLNEVLDEFSKKLISEQLSTTELKRYQDKGTIALNRLFKEYEYKLPKSSHPEQTISDIHLGSAVVSGKLDRIDKLDGELVIIDYKTGQPLSNFDTKNKTDSLKAYRHKLQLIFYALLLSDHPSYKQYGVISGQMVYIDAEDRRHLTLEYTPTDEDKLRLKNLIEAIYKRIINLDLPDISLYSHDLEGIKQFENFLLQ